MKKFILVCLSLILFGQYFSQTFEGVITFKKFSKLDTTTNVYNVKGNAVKLDQLGKKSGKVEGSFVFDLTSKKVKFVHPGRKVWGEQKSTVPATLKGTAKVEKTKNSKTICGLKCTEYIVSDETEKAKISYWIYSPDPKKKEVKFDFFMPVVQSLNRKDKASTYFKQITDLPAGSMPLLSIESTWEGVQVEKLETTKVDKKTVDAAAVSIPADYKKFEQ